MTSKDIDDLERIMRIKSYPDNYEFFKEGARGTDVHLLVEGQVGVTHHRGRQRGDIQMKLLKPCEMFGLIAAVTDVKHEASCRAIGPVTVATMPRTAFKLLFDANSTLGLHFLQLTVSQLANDYKSLNDLLRKAIFSTSEEEAMAVLSPVINTHIGVDRRSQSQDRRSIH
jgi:CRP-like cAMP-binding protein